MKISHKDAPFSNDPCRMASLKHKLNSLTLVGIELPDGFTVIQYVTSLLAGVIILGLCTPTCFRVSFFS